ncbi:ferredoxin [Acidiferrimicrobium sp. IK]|uniref:ferredoxin n=1 Tax=Acidiferrimicrobium sp. IK TaxID=2871700 RepID=UPI0021CB172E|nr:ferredoxin [Acidiferrimicrobium sp. IK]MCU4183259.1 ferredoxin [Acidiferrimicrobium sp. IK]
MRVRVDEEKCQGHTLCAMAAPDVFVLSDVDGHASAPVAAVPAEMEAAVRAAAGSCPEQAIVVEP